MGATGWDYFTPYQPDILAALQLLRDQVFASGEYFRPSAIAADVNAYWQSQPLQAQLSLAKFRRQWPIRERAMKRASAAVAANKCAPEDWNAMVETEYQKELAKFKKPPRLYRMKEKPKPASINALLAECQESGTHSIIDISGISSSPEIGRAFPMPPDVMHELYGSTAPERAQVENRKHERSNELEHWHCWYVIVYKEGQPHEIYFEGVSGH